MVPDLVALLGKCGDELDRALRVSGFGMYNLKAAPFRAGSPSFGTLPIEVPPYLRQE